MPTMLKRSLRFLASYAALAALLSPGAGAQTIRTVKASNPGGPGPWATSVTNLPAALAASVPGDEVWIAAGTYAGGITIPTGVKIYGGFAGTELSVGTRSADTSVNATVLSGGTHVVTASSTSPQTLLDRVTISGGGGGYTTTSGDNLINGAGIYSVGGAMIFVDCRIQNNRCGAYISNDGGAFAGAFGGSGGGAYVQSGSLSFVRCRFANNAASGGGSFGCFVGVPGQPGSSGSGGAIYVSGGSHCFADCEFSGNAAGGGGAGVGCATGNASSGCPGGHGGAAYSSGANLEFLRCQFISNHAGGGGAAGYRSCGFTGANAAAGGGGALRISGGTVSIESCKFLSNSAGRGGGSGGCGPAGTPGGAGGAVLVDFGLGAISNCQFVGNQAGDGGTGGLGADSVTHAAGGAGGNGGALYLSSQGVSVWNCTMSGNVPGGGGQGSPNGVPGGVGGVAGSVLSIVNSILWNNGGQQFSGATTLNSNCIQSQPPGPNGTNADPMFVNAATGDYHLLPGSPCINAGNSALVNFIADVDLDGRPRFVDAASIALAGPVARPAVDIGAYEFQFTPPDCTSDGIADIRQIGGNTLLTPTDITGGQLFGWASAISADFVAIGARAKDTARGIAAGQVNVYDRAGFSFGRVSTLIPPDGAPGDDFGNQVSLGGSWLAVGARFGDVGSAVDAGAAYVWRRDGLTWTYGQKLTAADSHAGDEFAHGLAIDGSAIIAGALLGDAPGAIDSGAAYIFRRGTSGTWAQEAKLVAGDAATGDGFGISVGISGATAVVGAAYRVEGGISSGAAYIFDFDGTTWTQTAKLVSAGAGAGDTFGELVAISGDTILVNSPRHTVNGRMQAGAVYAFQRTAGVWAPAATLASNAPQTGELFGFGLALRGNTAIVGGFARPAPSFGTRSGAAYVFRHIGTQWRLADRIDDPEPGMDAFFGYSVALSDTQFVVGAMQQTVRGVTQVGAARVFDLTILDSNRNGIPDSCDIATGVLIDADGDGIPDTIPSGLCRADFNENGTLNTQDIFDYLGAWFANDPHADFNGMNGLNTQDIFDYLAAWFAGC